MPSDRPFIKTYVTPDEKQEIMDAAARIGLSSSQYLSRLALGTRLPSFGQAEAVRDLLGIKADLARLGNLLKLTLDNIEEDNLSISVVKINRIIDDIDSTRSALLSKIKEL